MLRFIAFGLLVSACSAADSFSEPPVPKNTNPGSADIRAPLVESGESSPSPQEEISEESADLDPVAPLPDDSIVPEPEANPETETPVNDPVPQPEPLPTPQDPTAPQLDVKLNITTPSQVLRAGSNKLQLLSQLENATEGRILWSVEGPGSIDSNGLYSVASDVSVETSVKIVARWESNAEVRDEKVITLIPKNQIFVACKGSSRFPINADVYNIPANSTLLPDFNSIGNQLIGNFCMDGWDVTPRDWVGESPLLPDVIEWFGIRSVTMVNVPNNADYTFRLTSDDGAKLYVDDLKLIDNDGLHSVQSKEGRISLRSGSHKIVVEWYQGHRFQIALQLQWKMDGEANFSSIPVSSLIRP